MEVIEVLNKKQKMEAGFVEDKSPIVFSSNMKLESCSRSHFSYECYKLTFNHKYQGGKNYEFIWDNLFFVPQSFKVNDKELLVPNTFNDFIEKVQEFYIFISLLDDEYKIIKKLDDKYKLKYGDFFFSIIEKIIDMLCSQKLEYDFQMMFLTGDVLPPPSNMRKPTYEYFINTLGMLGDSSYTYFEKVTKENWREVCDNVREAPYFGDDIDKVIIVRYSC